MDINHADWQVELAAAIAGALGEFRCAAGDEMVLLAADCHPWSGTIALAFLTRAEALADPLLRDPAEMAAWRYYDFATRLDAWRPAAGVAAAMRDAYDRAGEGRHEIARRFLRGCAAAMASEAVRRGLAGYRRAEGFVITVPHPDTGAEVDPAG